MRNWVLHHCRGMKRKLFLSIRERDHRLPLSLIKNLKKLIYYNLRNENVFLSLKKHNRIVFSIFERAAFRFFLMEAKMITNENFGVPLLESERGEKMKNSFLEEHNTHYFFWVKRRRLVFLFLNRNCIPFLKKGWMIN